MEKMGLALQGGASFRDVGTVLGNGSLDGPEGAMNVANITQMERSPRRGMVGGAASLLHRGHELPRALSQEGMGLGEDEPFQENLNAR